MNLLGNRAGMAWWHGNTMHCNSPQLGGLTADSCVNTIQLPKASEPLPHRAFTISTTLRDRG